MEALTAGAAVAIAMLLTNLDNLVIAIAMAATGARRVVVAGLVVSLSAVLVVALGLGSGLDYVLNARIAYLGLIPILLGLHGLWHFRAGADDAKPGAGTPVGFWAATGTFLTLSVDTFLVQAPLLADTRPGLRPAALLGGFVGIALIGWLFSSVSTRLAGVAPRLERLGWIGPGIMICAGVYILLDTGTDAV